MPPPSADPKANSQASPTIYRCESNNIVARENSIRWWDCNSDCSSLPSGNQTYRVGPGKSIDSVTILPQLGLQTAEFNRNSEECGLYCSGDARPAFLDTLPEGWRANSEDGCAFNVEKQNSLCRTFFCDSFSSFRAR